MPDHAEPGISLEVCIWFEADPQHHDLVVASFMTLAQAVDDLASPMRPASSGPHTRPRLLRRPELAMREAGPRQTWMEIWPGVSSTHRQAFLMQLDQLAVQTGLSALASGPRHVEPFLTEAIAPDPR